jgi:hypothetical protein
MVFLTSDLVHFHYDISCKTSHCISGRFGAPASLHVTPHALPGDLALIRGPRVSAGFGEFAFMAFFDIIAGAVLEKLQKPHHADWSQFTGKRFQALTPNLFHCFHGDFSSITKVVGFTGLLFSHSFMSGLLTLSL